MNLYRIKDWGKIYENNRTRELRQLAWVPVPNNHDGDGYTVLTSHKDGAALLGAWIAIVQVASKCDPRGTLLRRSGIPHDPVSLSRITRLPVEIFKRAIEITISECNWLTVEDMETPLKIPQEGAGLSHDDAPRARARTEGNGMEQKGMELLLSDDREILSYLNKKTGRSYRETESNLGFIQARIKEEGVTVAGVKQMIDRQVERWKGTTMEEYLRPGTLFNKEKFDPYYAAREMPIIEVSDKSSNGRINGNHM